jgi:putative ABC transport system ATP-binding protein
MRTTTEFSNGSGAAARCRSVVKTYGDGETKVRALDGVDFDARFGEMTLLVGPSGCGKTTLISIVAGLLDANSGGVEVLGRSRADLRGAKLTQFRAENIGFVFQQYNLLPSLTAAENAAVPLLINRVRHSEAVRRAEAVLREVGLGDKINSRPSQLSGGQQQRVAIARALVHQPKLLVCDEPTAALDAKSGRTVMELLRRVALQSDRAVIVVTHDSRVYEFGDRIVEMSDGKVIRVDEARSTVHA